MGFLIDTNLWIALERGVISAADIHAIMREAPVYLSPMNLAEIRLGNRSLITDGHGYVGGNALRAIHHAVEVEPRVLIRVHRCSSVVTSFQLRN